MYENSKFSKRNSFGSKDNFEKSIDGFFYNSFVFSSLRHSEDGVTRALPSFIGGLLFVTLFFLYKKRKLSKTTISYIFSGMINILMPIIFVINGLVATFEIKRQL